MKTSPSISNQLLLAAGTFFVPTAASAQGGININALKPFSDSIIRLINDILVPVLLAIAFIVFLWGVYKYYILKGASDTDRATGHKFILWGIIGFVIIFSVWGFVNLFRSVLGLTNDRSPNPPTIFGGSASQPNNNNPAPIATCTDQNADNYGGPTPCTYESSR